jgi:Ca-activated chloride channel family protein
MTDELDTLKAALKAGPAPDAPAKADAIAWAMKNFDALQSSGQGSPDALRPNPVRPVEAGIWNRIGTMLKRLTTRQALAGTASVAAICIAVVLVDQAPDMVGTGKPVVTDQPEVVVVQEPAAAVPPESDVDRSAGEVGRRMDQQSTAQIDAAPVVTPEPALLPPPANDSGYSSTEVAPSAKILDEEKADARGRSAIAGDAVSDGAPMRSEAAPTDGLAGGTQAYAGQAQPASPAQSAGNATVASEQFAAPVPSPDVMPQPEPNTEAFANEAPNPVKVTSEEPVSTFSIDVDTASYAVVRNSLNMGMLPPPEAVRIEEMINYFPYDYPAPTAEDGPFKPTVTVMPSPWNPGTRLVHIGIQGAMPSTDERPALNLVFLIDTSGSMDEPNKLPLLQQSLSLMLGKLRPQDQVAIVAYAGSAGVVLEPTDAKDVAKISAALNDLAAGGSTAGAEGLELAYQVAAKMDADGEVSRVLLATDGDFNVGVNDPEGLEAYVAKKRETGIYLSVLGFGRGNLDDAIMQSLAQNGNGTAAYIDTLNEARKVLVDQLTGALFPIADDVKIQVEWNPAAVTEYRLIGYETRALRREDFNNDRIDAGEIGAGVTVTAIYEVVPYGSDARLNDPLRYGNAPGVEVTLPADEMGFLRLRAKAPGATTSNLIETPIPNRISEIISDDARFATSIAGFGQLLTGATYLGDWGWDQAIAMALAARGDDPFGYRIEAVNLMRMAQSLSAQ